MTREEIRHALTDPSKVSRKALAKMAWEMETEEPERYKKILSETRWEGEAKVAYCAYRTAKTLSYIAMILAVIVVVAGYLVGDFGMQLLTGWLNRYALAAGILVAMGLFAGGTLLLNSRKERLIAYGVLEDM